MLRKYANVFGRTYVYHTKENFISDICQHLQEIKKNLSKGGRALFHQIMILRHPFLKYPNEEWTFNIYVKEDGFVITTCVLTECNSGRFIKYFGEELKRTHDDELYNKCRNITELREFFKREVGNTIPV